MEHIQDAACSEGFTRMWHLRGDDHRLPGFEHHAHSAHHHFKSALQQGGDLLMHMGVLGQGCARVHIHIGEGHAVGMYQPGAIAGCQIEYGEMLECVQHEDRMMSKGNPILAPDRCCCKCLGLACAARPTLLPSRPLLRKAGATGSSLMWARWVYTKPNFKKTNVLHHVIQRRKRNPKRAGSHRDCC